MLYTKDILSVVAYTETVRDQMSLTRQYSSVLVTVWRVVIAKSVLTVRY